jgi:hypothetical protein
MDGTGEVMMGTRVENLAQNPAKASHAWRWPLVASALLGISTLATMACGTQAAPSQQIAGGAMSVNCGVGQQAIIRPAVVNGQTISQVDCVTTATQPAPGQINPGQITTAPMNPPMSTGPATYGVPAGYAPVSPAGYTPVSYLAPAPVGAVAFSDPRVRTVAVNDRIVEYRPRVVRRVRARSAKNSAVIIASSAGIGAGIGAAIHGGKGALIGAALGGGGAAIWDQATRRH